jgi:phosphatidylglycerophosphate synthase
MSDADAQTLPFRIVSEQPSPRFLGLTVDERNARVVRRAAARATAADTENGATVFTPVRGGTLRIPPGLAITPALIDFLPRGEGVWHLVWDHGRPPIVWTASRDSALPPATSRVPDGAVLDVATASARHAASWRLLRASGKSTDGWLSRHVHRKISRVCSYLLLRLGLGANHATFLTLLVGVAAAALVMQTSHATLVAGCLLFWFASIADGIDGEMARLTFSESAWGEQLDTAVDFATFLLCYAALLVGWWRQGMGRWGWVIAVGTAMAVLAVVFWGMHLVRRARGQRDRIFVDTKPIEIGIRNAARATGAVPLRVASAIFVLFRREAFSLVFVGLSLFTAWRGIFPAAIASGLAFVAVTLFAYGSAIEEAIRRADAFKR